MNKRSNGIILSYVYTGVNMLCGLFLSSFLIRMLGDTEYGIYQTISSFANYLVLLEFGTGTVMSRNISVCRNNNERDRLKNNASTVWYMTLFLSVVILAAALAFFFNIGRIYSRTMSAEQVAYAEKIFAVITLNLLFSFLTQSLNGYLLGMEQYTFAKTMSIIKIAAKTVMLILIISFSRHAIFIAAVEAALSMSILCVTFIYSKKKYSLKLKIKYFDKSILKSSLPLCLALLLQTIMNQANSNVDKFVIGILMTVETVAIYSVAQYIYSMFSSIVTIPVAMYLPQVSKNLAKGLSGKALTETLIAPCRLVSVIGGTVMCGFFAVGRQFISLLYGKNKEEAWLCAMVIIVPMFINATDAVVINVLDVVNKRLVRSLILTGTTVLNIILTVLLISDYGMIGAAIATAVSMVIGNIALMNIYYQKKLGLKIPYLFAKAYKGILPFQLIAALIAFFAARMIERSWLSVLAGGSVYLLLSGSAIILFGLGSEEKQTLNSLLLKLKTKLLRQ